MIAPVEKLERMKLPLPEDWQPKAGRYYAGLPMERYHAAPGVSSTFLRKALSHSPWFAYEAQRRGEEAGPAAQDGTLAHSAILEPETLERDYLFAPRPLFLRADKAKGVTSEQAKRDREEWDALQEEAAATGRIARRERPADIDQMVADVHSHPLVRRIWKHTRVVEHSHWWHDDETGLLLKRRPDLEIPEWADGRGLIVDVKTSQDHRIPAFSRSVARYGYGIQAAMYCAGFEALHGYPADFVWLVVRSKSPHEVSVLSAEKWLPHGEERFRAALELIARCERTGEYPRQYGGRAMVPDMPSWAREEYGDENDE